MVFVFCEEISQLYIEGIEINVIKVESIPCVGKLNFRYGFYSVYGPSPTAIFVAQGRGRSKLCSTVDHGS